MIDANPGTLDQSRGDHPVGPRRSWLRRLALPVLIVATLAAGGAAWKAHTAGEAAAVPTHVPLPAERPVELAAVEITRAAPRTLVETVRVSGSVQPLEQSLVKSEVAARLVEVPVREGQAVRKGQVLARFDTVELTAKLNEKLSNLEGAKAQLVLAEKTRAKNFALRQKDIVSETNMDQAQSTFRFQQAAVSALEAQVELSRKALRDATVLSPIDGTVAERAINPGETLAVNAKMFSVVDLSRVEVEATVPADDVARLKPGQTVRLRVEGFGAREFVGEIARINPMARAGTRAIPVYVSLDNADGSLRGGMFAAGDAVVAQADRAFALPPAAVRHDAEGDFALVVAKDRVERRKVQVLGTWSRGDLVQVDGLAEGDVVVTAPLPGLAAGRAVKVVGS
ncbi:efflux RND transporter periplasmic adaptor subunit [Azospirillum rugosum]|uniref:RND family efflux transporter MFP subunit n=1 Tax=Azospirillum rugosum TaxID=416170 RepID=A0ABS4SPG8_9PROT|nr:efflux RND transporter periplasmic adaptor subunit [Azospirillum rugosum]MBP2294451.1 RND family efflux transporter MFP subunit [Azospirillum rugosum]MDQ0528956.1 RND family efflux transporter MFP subunit [Azospirillum rugosum]